MTTDTEVASWRMKPKVAVALAMSRGWTVVLGWLADCIQELGGKQRKETHCKEISGLWKLGPIPIPATSWKQIIFAQLAFGPRSMNRP